jgi:hypothetical protein
MKSVELHAKTLPPSKLKKSFEKQAAAYPKLAAKRARKLGILEPPGSISHIDVQSVLSRNLKSRI